MLSCLSCKSSTASTSPPSPLAWVCQVCPSLTRQNRGICRLVTLSAREHASNPLKPWFAVLQQCWVVLKADNTSAKAANFCLSQSRLSDVNHFSGGLMLLAITFIHMSCLHMPCSCKVYVNVPILTRHHP